MEACIEALFNIEGENGKRKTIEMIRVLKGAISVSKSRTGEVIYHYNRHEKKALWRQLAKYDRDTRRSRLEIEHQKRDILRKWSLVFGRQRNFCDSIRGFDDMLAEAIVLKDKLKDEEEDEEEEEEVKPAQEELDRLEQEENQKKSLMEDPTKRRLFARQNPTQGTSSTATGTAATQPSTATTGMLPKINVSGTLFNGRIETEQEEKERLEREAEEERKRKAKELPQFDKALVKDYLKQQKSMHEELLTRNTLMKIKSQANNDHIFFKYRMKTKLPSSAHSLLRHIETDRPFEADNVQERDIMTRQSTRSELLPSRLKSNVDMVSRSEESRGTSRLLARQLRHHASLRKGSVPVPKGGDSLPITSRISITAGGAFPPKLGERSKTVHFS